MQNAEGPNDFLGRMKVNLTILLKEDLALPFCHGKEEPSTYVKAQHCSMPAYLSIGKGLKTHWLYGPLCKLNLCTDLHWV